MELNHQVNILKKLGYDADNLISVQLLGNLAKKKWAQIIVRSNPTVRNECYEYTVYLAHDSLSANPLRQGNTITGILRVLQHPKGKIWNQQIHKVI